MSKMKKSILLIALVIAAQSISAECVTFVDSDANPAFTVDLDTHAVAFDDRVLAAFNQFECLKGDDPLPPDLSFMTREALIRFAALDLTPPQTWSAGYVREVFRSREDVMAFLNRYYSSRQP